ncbi:MAG TPA: hypothetical protein VL282_17420, partial [Tepidisphaeraceae bacterium]|nr:hypothetical protein [Tepidisphaeraceae bacterium]
VFQIIKLLETTSSFEIARGEATFDIPQDTMHSFEAGNNKIIWELKIRGEIARWPDMSADYPVQIVPMEMAMSEVQA